MNSLLNIVPWLREQVKVLISHEGFRGGDVVLTMTESRLDLFFPLGLFKIILLVLIV